MSLVGLLVAVLIFLLVWYLIGLLPLTIQQTKILRIVLIVIAILYLLSALGLLNGLRVT